jgi:hypothetical protein
MRLSKYSNRKAIETASSRPPRKPTIRLNRVRGSTGPRGRSAASTMRTLLVRSCVDMPVSSARWKSD